MKLVYRLTILTLLLAYCGMAGTTGKIAGRILDAKSNEPLIGASVIVVGTTYGGATDVDGNYYINNIPPGSYRVNIDLTTRIDLTLSEQVIQIGKEIIVTAERPLVQKDLTATTAVVGGDDIKQLPVTEISQVIGLQAGNIGGSIRGGRKGETAYWIDGVPVTDVFDGGSVVDVNPSMVQELQVLSGAFNAEYGQAMSGIVNIATREGAEKFSGSVTVYGGDFLTSHTNIFKGKTTFDPLNIRNIEASISGPVVKDVSFFVNARAIYFGGYLDGFNRFTPSTIATVSNNSLYVLGTDPKKDSLAIISAVPAAVDPSIYPTVYNYFKNNVPNPVGDGKTVSMNWNKKTYLQSKLALRLMPELKLNVTGIMDNVDSYPFDRFYMYNPDGKGLDYRRSYTGIAALTHTLSNSTFYTVGLSIFSKEFRHQLYDDPYDSRYTHPDLLIALNGISEGTGGSDLNRYHRMTTTALAKIDVNSQVTNEHFLKFGVEYRHHRLFMENINLRPIDEQTTFSPGFMSPYIQTQILSADTSLQHDIYWHHPYELSAYVQDKMEFKSLIINIGVRFDYFQPDGNVLTDDEDPSIYYPAKASNQFFDDNGNGVQDPNERSKTLQDRLGYWYKKASAKWQISPRFGASFPITDRGVIHFSYGHFFQVPNFERLYQNPLFKVGKTTGNVDLNGAPMGNADLKPEQTINAEIGLQQQLTEDLSLDVTAYLRDIRNLTGTGADQIGVGGPLSARQYTKYINRDFGFVRGFIVTLNKRFAQGLSVNVDYTFQVARGTASDPNETRSNVTGSKQPEIQLSPLAWDQRHTLNAILNYSTDTYGGSIIGQYGSGQPYTPKASSDVTVFLTNSNTKPTFMNVDLKMYRSITVDPLKLLVFLRVNNVFDIKNETDVYTDTGTATKTYDETRARTSGTKEYVNSITDYYTNPTMYSEPRRIEFGATIEF
ncbi:MAG: TonB-dependent receptor [Ignavibacteriales bacterium]|nr:TonB-dependent receptor [Ignavibacteriales bacterium]